MKIFNAFKFDCFSKYTYILRLFHFCVLLTFQFIQQYIIFHLHVKNVLILALFRFTDEITCSTYTETLTILVMQSLLSSIRVKDAQCRKALLHMQI